MDSIAEISSKTHIVLVSNDGNPKHNDIVSSIDESKANYYQNWANPNLNVETMKFKDNLPFCGFWDKISPKRDLNPQDLTSNLPEDITETSTETTGNESETEAVTTIEKEKYCLYTPDVAKYIIKMTLNQETRNEEKHKSLVIDFPILDMDCISQSSTDLDQCYSYNEPLTPESHLDQVDHDNHLATAATATATATPGFKYKTNPHLIQNKWRVWEAEYKNISVKNEGVAHSKRNRILIKKYGNYVRKLQTLSMHRYLSFAVKNDLSLPAVSTNLFYCIYMYIS